MTTACIMLITSSWHVPRAGRCGVRATQLVFLSTVMQLAWCGLLLLLTTSLLLFPTSGLPIHNNKVWTETYELPGSGKVYALGVVGDKVQMALPEGLAIVQVPGDTMGDTWAGGKAEVVNMTVLADMCGMGGPGLALGPPSRVSGAVFLDGSGSRLTRGAESVSDLSGTSLWVLDLGSQGVCVLDAKDMSLVEVHAGLGSSSDPWGNVRVVSFAAESSNSFSDTDLFDYLVRFEPDRVLSQDHSHFHAYMQPDTAIPNGVAPPGTGDQWYSLPFYPHTSSPKTQVTALHLPSCESFPPSSSCAYSTKAIDVSSCTRSGRAQNMSSTYALAAVKPISSTRAGLHVVITSSDEDQNTHQSVCSVVIDVAEKEIKVVSAVDLGPLPSHMLGTPPVRLAQAAWPAAHTPFAYVWQADERNHKAVKEPAAFVFVTSFSHSGNTSSSFGVPLDKLDSPLSAYAAAAGMAPDGSTYFLANPVANPGAMGPTSFHLQLVAVSLTDPGKRHISHKHRDQRGSAVSATSNAPTPLMNGTSVRSSVERSATHEFTFSVQRQWSTFRLSLVGEKEAYRPAAHVSNGDGYPMAINPNSDGRDPLVFVINLVDASKFTISVTCQFPVPAGDDSCPFVIVAEELSLTSAGQKGGGSVQGLEWPAASDVGKEPILPRCAFPVGKDAEVLIHTRKEGEEVSVSIFEVRLGDTVGVHLRGNVTLGPGLISYLDVQSTCLANVLVYASAEEDGGKVEVTVLDLREKTPVPIWSKRTHLVWNSDSLVSLGASLTADRVAVFVDDQAEVLSLSVGEPVVSFPTGAMRVTSSATASSFSNVAIDDLGFMYMAAGHSLHTAIHVYSPKGKEVYLFRHGYNAQLGSASKATFVAYDSFACHPRSDVADGAPCFSGAQGYTVGLLAGELSPQNHLSVFIPNHASYLAAAPAANGALGVGSLLWTWKPSFPAWDDGLLDMFALTNTSAWTADHRGVWIGSAALKSGAPGPYLEWPLCESSPSPYDAFVQWYGLVPSATKPGMVYVFGSSLATHPFALLVS